jgi:ribosomal protein L16 Arg81 hydroxylase
MSETGDDQTGTSTQRVSMSNLKQLAKNNGGWLLILLAVIGTDGRRIVDWFQDSAIKAEQQAENTEQLRAFNKLVQDLPLEDLRKLAENLDPEMIQQKFQRFDQRITDNRTDIQTVETRQQDRYEDVVERLARLEALLTNDQSN